MKCEKCKIGNMVGVYSLLTPADVNFTCDNCGDYIHTDESTECMASKEYDYAKSLREDYGKGAS